MSMTMEEIIKKYEVAVEGGKQIAPLMGEDAKEIYEMLKAGLSALRHQIWEEQLWHDAKTDPPKTPGLYYGKKDDANSMYACRYRDGVWVLDMYPQQRMDIVKWADYTAFVREE